MRHHAQQARAEEDAPPVPIPVALSARPILRIRVWVALWWTRRVLAFLMARRSLPFVMDWIARHAPAGTWAAAWLPQALFALERSLRIPTHSSHRLCLPRSLLLYYTLLRMGIPAQVNIGLDTSSREHGHAWVTRDGQPFLDGQNQAGLFPVFLHSSGALNYWVVSPSSAPAKT